MSSQIKTWQQALQACITDPKVLAKQLNIKWVSEAEKSTKQFPLRVPQEWISRIEQGNPNDPLLKQVLPLQQEMLNVPGYVSDPLHERAFNPLPGLLHKYAGRVLVTLTGACGIHCRYCFRREFPYKKNNAGRLGWEAILNYIQNDSTIFEVIFSGGDPLTVSDNLLKKRILQLNQIKHLKYIRIHTRLPIIIPTRICHELLDWIESSTLKIIFVMHCNHPNEIDHTVKNAMQKLKEKNVTLLNQSVLLKNINDSAETLIALSLKLFDANILPYYLHLLDKVKGTAHFDLPKTMAISLHKIMTENLPGYLVPKLVTEMPGEKSKIRCGNE